MAKAPIPIPIGNNIIYTKKKGSEEKKDSVQTVLFGAERVDVGINSGKKEIAKDKESGLNYERDAIDGKTIYNLRNQEKKCFFVLDLETGKRGKNSWYPGAIRIADINGKNIDIKSEKSETSQTIITVSNVTVKILDVEYDDAKNIWYKVDYNAFVGYVRNTYIKDVRYSDPY